MSTPCIGQRRSKHACTAITRAVGSSLHNKGKLQTMQLRDEPPVEASVCDTVYDAAERPALIHVHLDARQQWLVLYAVVAASCTRLPSLGLGEAAVFSTGSKRFLSWNRLA
jgi:hypothetical protein